MHYEIWCHMLNNEYLLNDISNNNQNKIHFPNTNFNNLTKLILFIYNFKKDNPHENLLYYFIIQQQILPKSDISSAKTIAKELGLMRDIRTVYSLTEEGQNFARFSLDNDEEKIKTLGEELIVGKKKSPVLYYGYKLLKENPSINNLTIGELIKEKYNKDWTEIYCRNLGNHTRNILLGFKLIDPPKPNYSSERYLSEKNVNPNEKFLPRMSIKIIKNYIKAFIDNNPINFYEKFDYKAESTIRYELKTLTDLGLLNEKDSKYYNLTLKGTTYKHSLEENNDRETFKTILKDLKPIKYIINQLKKRESEIIDYKLLGKIIEYYNQVNYSSNSIKIYGSVLLKWLKYSEILVEENGYNILNLEDFEYSIQKHKLKDNSNNHKIDVIFYNGENNYNEVNIFDKLFEYYSDLFYSVLFINNNEWSLTNYKKVEIIKILNELEKVEDQIIKIIYFDAKKWFIEAYETNNKKYLKHSYDLVTKIKNYNKEQRISNK